MSETATAPSPAFRPTLFHLALLIPWVALVIASFERVWDNSFLWHIRAGTLQLDAGSVLTSDPFSFTVAGEPWRTQSWLVETGYGWLEGRFGLAYVGVMVLVFGLLTMVGLGLLAWRHSRSVPATAVVLILSTVLLPQFLVPRPALFSFPLFVLLALAWDRPDQRWAVPFIFWLWASIHGSFAIGLVYVALRIIQTREWRALRIGIVSGVACLVTAHGLGVLEMLLDFARARPYLSLISEWQPPDFLEVATLPFLLGILLIVYGATKGRLQTNVLWIVGPFLLLAVSAERALGPAWIALVPVIAASLEDMTVSWSRGFRRPMALVFMLVILLLPFLFVEPVEIDDERFPVAAASELEDLPTFHDDYVGGYLIWRSGPEDPVYIDDRAELYQERVEEFVDIRSGVTDWEEPFRRDGIEQALLDAGEPLAADLEEAGWNAVYTDDEFVVLRP